MITRYMAVVVLTATTAIVCNQVFGQLTLEKGLAAVWLMIFGAYARGLDWSPREKKEQRN